MSLTQPFERFKFGAYPLTYVAKLMSQRIRSRVSENLDHPGIVLNDPIGALAHPGLARAYALQGDTAKARAAYNDFLTLWKDADPDIPILQQAKAEYVKAKVAPFGRCRIYTTPTSYELLPHLTDALFRHTRIMPAVHSGNGIAARRPVSVKRVSRALSGLYCTIACVEALA